MTRSTLAALLVCASAATGIAHSANMASQAPVAVSTGQSCRFVHVIGLSASVARQLAAMRRAARATGCTMRGAES
jgi:hypothetical protein